MKIVTNWKEISARAWSMWGLYALIAFTIAEATIPQIDMPADLQTAITIAISGITALLRLIDQKVEDFLRSEDGGINLSRIFAPIVRLFSRRAGRKRAATAAVAATTLVAFIGPWEGLRTTAYPDRLARNVPTVCYGETRGVKLGDVYSKAECDAMLARAVEEFQEALRDCMPPLDTFPQGVQTALISWTYNVGPGAACSSTLRRKALAGDLEGACHELPRWNRAGGRVLRGLSNRRGAERALCLEAL